MLKNIRIDKARKSLRSLNQAIFSCFLDSAYQDNLYLFERRIHLQKRNFMRAIMKVSGSSLVHFNLLFDCMMNYAQLRWRITDFTVLSVCAKELNALCQAIDASLAQKKNAASQLMFAIQQLEAVYQQVLQISSPDPLAFLLFIDGIKGFTGNK